MINPSDIIYANSNLNVLIFIIMFCVYYKKDLGVKLSNTNNFLLLQLATIKPFQFR